MFDIMYHGMTPPKLPHSHSAVVETPFDYARAKGHEIQWQYGKLEDGYGAVLDREPSPLARVIPVIILQIKAWHG